jgi:hypothetical protein
MRTDAAARLNGVEKTLAGFLVAWVDVPVLAKARTVLRLPSQIFEVLGVERFHHFSAHQAMRAATICRTVLSTVNSR